MEKIKVRVKKPEGKYGFYGSKRRYNGNEFFLERESDFSSDWMEKISDGKKSSAPNQKKG